MGLLATHDRTRKEVDEWVWRKHDELKKAAEREADDRSGGEPWGSLVTQGASLEDVCVVERVADLQYVVNHLVFDDTL